MKFAIRTVLRVLLVLGMVSVTQTSAAQSTTGSIYGAVTDTTGAAVPGATVTIRDVRTNVTQATTTNGSGEYTFAIVNPSDYTATSTAAGFKMETQTRVVLAANHNVHVVSRSRWDRSANPWRSRLG